MSAAPRTVAVVTGTRAELGLLTPVMRAIDTHPALRLRVIAAGAHMLPPDRTVDELRRLVAVHAEVTMQEPGATRRVDDAAALGRGVGGFANAFERERPDVVVVLGDRIEAFAAAAAASVAGTAVAHLHGGDRAPGVADEAMRHAITKLAHVHLPATDQSAQRIVAMGELPRRVHVVGSPALDDLGAVAPLDDAAYAALGRPAIVVLLHPLGRSNAQERRVAEVVLQRAMAAGPTLALHPNHDPGRDGIVAAIEAAGVPTRTHLERAAFVGLLRRIELLVGNSSAALIEGAALAVAAVDVGERQSGRERAANVVSAEEGSQSIAEALRAALAMELPTPMPHPFGDGRAGPRTAEVLATCELGDEVLRKRCAY